jgi:hypothetical protein
MKTNVIAKGARAATPAREEPTALNKHRAEMERIKDADRAKAREAAKAKKTAKAPQATTARKDAAKAKTATKAAAKQPRAATKTAQVIAMLERKDGATAAQLLKATGWQAHSLRGFISGTLAKKMGLTVASAKGEDGAGASTESSPDPLSLLNAPPDSRSTACFVFRDPTRRKPVTAIPPPQADLRPASGPSTRFPSLPTGLLMSSSQPNVHSGLDPKTR